MSVAGFPTSSDIYLEVDGTRVAVVQSYTAKTTKSSTAVEAFGESEPVATIPGQAVHTVQAAVRHRRGHPGRHRLLQHVRLLPGHLQAGPENHLQRLPVELH